ncbi:universal stress protein [Chloroflexota bacterium]
MLKQILVCLDGSSLAEQILPFVTEQALNSKSKVTLVRVLDVPATVAWIEGVDTDSDIVTPKSHIDEEQVVVYLESVADSVRSKGLEVENVVLHNIAADRAIVDYANKNEMDLIAITTHGRTGLMRAVLGSIADSVLRGSHLPILIIRPKD